MVSWVIVNRKQFLVLEIMTLFSCYVPLNSKSFFTHSVRSANKCKSNILSLLNHVTMSTEVYIMS